MIFFCFFLTYFVYFIALKILVVLFVLQPFLFTSQPPLLRRRVHSKFVFEAKNSLKMKITQLLRYMDGPGGRNSQNGKIQVRFSVIKSNKSGWNKCQKKLTLTPIAGYGFEEYETSHRSDSFVCNHGFGYDLGDLLLLPFGLINHRCQLVEEARTPRILQEQAVQILQPLRHWLCQGRMQSTHLQGLNR